eukprot:scaffold57178_cov42-Phaeocystis_antarctica.AAC.1
MLKQRPAGDKSWPIACSQTTLGVATKELDLSGAHLSYGDFEEATFTGAGAIKLIGAGLAHADLSGSKFTVRQHGDNRNNLALIDFTEANLTNVDLSGSELTADGANFGHALIDFTKANLAHADVSDSKLTTDAYYGATIDFTEADLAHADLSGSELTAINTVNYFTSAIDFTEATFDQTDLSGSKLTAKTIIGLPPTSPLQPTSPLPRPSPPPPLSLGRPIMDWKWPAEHSV